MQDSRIEQKIEDIYGFVESCKMQSFSTTKVIVPKNDLYDLLHDTVLFYQRIILLLRIC